MGEEEGWMIFAEVEFESRTDMDILHKVFVTGSSGGCFPVQHALFHALHTAPQQKGVTLYIFLNLQQERELSCCSP